VSSSIIVRQADSQFGGIEGCSTSVELCNLLIADTITLRDRYGNFIPRKELMSRRIAHFSVLLLLAAHITDAGADDKAAYDRRAATRDMNLFQSLDRNNDQAVTKLESHGDLDFGPRFDDMDINRDGIVTRAELLRYVEREHGAVTISAGLAARQ
jgi:hypothetical protein